MYNNNKGFTYLGVSMHGINKGFKIRQGHDANHHTTMGCKKGVKRSTHTRQVGIPITFRGYTKIMVLTTTIYKKGFVGEVPKRVNMLTVSMLRQQK
jgi:hypothetical protein